MKDRYRDEAAVEKLVKDVMNTEIPPDVEGRFRRHLTDFRTKLEDRHARRFRLTHFVRLAYRVSWAMIIIGVIAGGTLYLLAGNSTPTWAQVMERFASVSCLQGTMYVRDGVLGSPVEMEFWMGHGGKLRLHAGNKVIFGDKGRFIEDVPFGPAAPRSPESATAEATVQNLAEKMGGMDTFSFEVLLRLLPEIGELSAPLRIQEATVSKDLVVFDLASKDSPEWVRIWTLRESRLPVRVRYWDPRKAQSMDVLLSYGNEQPLEFFDPKAFKARLATCKTAADRAYALIADMGGQPVTPHDAQTQKRAREQAAKEPATAPSGT